MIKVFYYLNNGVIDHIECDCQCTIKELLNQIKEKYDDLQNINYAYLKGNKLDEGCSLKNYANDLEYAPLIISNEPTKSFENYLHLIDINNYTNFQDIGQSSFYNCIKAYDRKNKKHVFIRALETIKATKVKIFRAIFTLCDVSTINHPGISKILGFSYPMKDQRINVRKDQSKYSMNLSSYYIFVFEYEKYGNLEQFVSEYLKGNQVDVMNPTIRCKIIYGVASAMKAAHHKNIICQHLSMSHILIDKKCEVKLSQFEYKDLYKANIRRADLRSDLMLGSPPEAPIFENEEDEDEFFDDEINKAGDVFAYSLFLYKMFENDFKKYDNGMKMKKNVYIFSVNIGYGRRPVRPENIPDQYWELIQRCWKQNPEERPTFDEIVEELLDDKYRLEEYGMKTNLDELHEYQKRIQEFEYDHDE